MTAQTHLCRQTSTANVYFHYRDSAHVGKASFNVFISAVACESGDKMRGGRGGGGCDFLERSLDREQNRLLLHIAPFKMFLLWTLRVLLAGCTVSGGNNQAWTRKGRQPLTVWGGSIPFVSVCLCVGSIVGKMLIISLRFHEDSRAVVHSKVGPTSPK